MPGCNIMGVIHVSEEQMLHTAHAGHGFQELRMSLGLEIGFRVQYPLNGKGILVPSTQVCSSDSPKNGVNGFFSEA